jgi:hypothetical protein
LPLRRRAGTTTLLVPFADTLDYRKGFGHTELVEVTPADLKV